VTEPLNYSLQDRVIQEASSSEYLGIILHRDLRWANQVNYMVERASKALKFTMHNHREVNSNII
jgi:hypothetical protein